MTEHSGVRKREDLVGCVSRGGRSRRVGLNKGGLIARTKYALGPGMSNHLGTWPDAGV